MREALKLARRVLSNTRECDAVNHAIECIDKALAQPEQKMTYQQAAQLINEMKSQPEQKPVAWEGDCVLGHCRSPAGCEESNCCRADYTTPPQRKPLTDEEIENIQFATKGDNHIDRARNFARAIEAAHGIKE